MGKFDGTKISDLAISGQDLSDAGLSVVKKVAGKDMDNLQALKLMLYVSRKRAVFFDTGSEITLSYVKNEFLKDNEKISGINTVKNRLVTITRASQVCADDKVFNGFNFERDLFTKEDIKEAVKSLELSNLEENLVMKSYMSRDAKDMDGFCSDVEYQEIYNQKTKMQSKSGGTKYISKKEVEDYFKKAKNKIFEEELNENVKQVSLKQKPKSAGSYENHNFINASAVFKSALALFASLTDQGQREALNIIDTQFKEKINGIPTSEIRQEYAKSKDLISQRMQIFFLINNLKLGEKDAVRIDNQGFAFALGGKLVTLLSVEEELEAECFSLLPLFSLVKRNDLKNSIYKELYYKYYDQESASINETYQSNADQINFLMNLISEMSSQGIKEDSKELYGYTEINNEIYESSDEKDPEYQRLKDTMSEFIESEKAPEAARVISNLESELVKIKGEKTFTEILAALEKNINLIKSKDKGASVA